MNLLDRINEWVTGPPTEMRTVQPAFEFPSLESQIGALQAARYGSWTTASVQDALSVPSVYRAVTLIANTVGTLSMDAWRADELMEPEERPSLIIRPNPRTTPREFYRATAYSMATRGEAWWWIAKRDGDGVPISLYPMPANQVVVSHNDANPLRPRIEWQGQVMPNDDVRQITFNRELDSLRGDGPLQKCGAAVSVAVESTQWAANFFAQGGVPSIIVQTATPMTEDEVRAFKAQWLETPSNQPRIIDPGVEEIKDFGFDPGKAQLVESRRYERGEVATMFGIPNALMGHSEAGSSLTYQNISQVYDEFVKACLWPGYLEPIEQTMSDLLTRATTARFNVDGLLRPDIKTRFEVHEKAIATGVYDADYARVIEGLAPGNIETAPVPLSPPAAAITSLPAGVEGSGSGATVIRTEAPTEVRCQSVVSVRGRTTRCHKLLYRGAAPAPHSLYCTRCKSSTEAA